MAGEQVSEELLQELYQGDPAEFVAVRNERARAAREAGDEGLARSIGGLRKPTTAAWAVNRVAAEHPRRVAELVELGDELRAAQRELRGEEIRRLGRRRADLVADLTARSAQVVERGGKQLAEQARRQVESTFAAAVAEPESARRVRAGTLSGALEHSGFGLDELSVAAMRSTTARHRGGTGPRRGGAQRAADRQGTAGAPRRTEGRSGPGGARDVAADRPDARTADRAAGDQDRTTGTGKRRAGAAQDRPAEEPAPKRGGRTGRRAKGVPAEETTPERGAAEGGAKRPASKRAPSRGGSAEAVPAESAAEAGRDDVDAAPEERAGPRHRGRRTGPSRTPRVEHRARGGSANRPASGADTGTTADREEAGGTGSERASRPQRRASDRATSARSTAAPADPTRQAGQDQRRSGEEQRRSGEDQRRSGEEQRRSEDEQRRSEDEQRWAEDDLRRAEQDRDRLERRRDELRAELEELTDRLRDTKRRVTRARRKQAATRRRGAAHRDR
ncbi:hypothetical protein [Saccharopolyspora gregorii]|uniref:DUF222 domain-containing protein n=1 Tax=Saccharopolyspora gregorii TaxID=33914 RepID=A0ABP6RSK2_9PSEU